MGLGTRGRGRRWEPLAASARPPPPSRAHTCCLRLCSPAARGPAPHLSLPARPQGRLPGFLACRGLTHGRDARRNCGQPLLERAVAAEAGACPRAVALRREFWAAEILSCGPSGAGWGAGGLCSGGPNGALEDWWEPRGSSLELALVRGSREPGFGEGLRRVQGHTAGCTAQLSHLVARRRFLGGEGPSD